MSSSTVHGTTAAKNAFSYSCTPVMFFRNRKNVLVSLYEEGQGVLVYLYARGRAWAPQCLSLPWGKAPQRHCCPHSVAEQGGPGGGAERSTLKRGCSACWHLPSLTAAGTGKICFSICLCSLQPSPAPSASPHCPLLSAPLSPVLTRWLSEHCLSWVADPDVECPSASPFCPISSFLCTLTWIKF